jgi:hypothetical protein
MARNLRRSYVWRTSGLGRLGTGAMRRPFVYNFSALLLLAAFGWGGIAARAGELPLPQGPVVLTVSGSIANTNAEGHAKFDRNMLENIGLTEFRTMTNWFEDEVHFEGILARELLTVVAAEGKVVHAQALNGYHVEIPLDDFRSYDVLLALKMNGSYMKIRDKGPIWLVYPQSAHDELDRPEIYARWIWQLESFEVR